MSYLTDNEAVTARTSIRQAWANLEVCNILLQFLSKRGKVGDLPSRAAGNRSKKAKELLRCGGGHDIPGLSWKAGALELNSDVIDAEGIVKFLADRAKQCFAGIHVHVRDAGVATERVVVTTEGPDVDVVHFMNTGHGENGACDFFDFEILRTPFQKNVGGIAEDADTGPENQQTDGEAENGVDPVIVGVMNDDCANDDGDVRESIAEIVDENAAEVQVLVAAHNGKSYAAIDGKCGE